MRTLIFKRMLTVGAMAALASMPCLTSAETVGLWNFDGTVGDSIAIGTQFANQVDAAKYPATVVNRYNGTASTSHLSTFVAFEDAPFNAYRTSRFGEDVPMNTGIHIDGKVEGGANNQTGCPVSIADDDGELELQSFTFEFFVRRKKTSNGQAGFWLLVFSKLRNSSTYNGLYRGDNAKWTFNYCCVTNEAGLVKSDSINFGQKGIEDGKWHHLALVVDGDAHTVKLFIDHAQVGSTGTLPGPLAYSDGSSGHHPWIIGHETQSWASWAGDIAAMRISNTVLSTDNMLWQGSTVPDGGTVMWLPLDNDFNAYGWSGLQPTNDTYETEITNNIANGKVVFTNSTQNVRIADGSNVTLRDLNAGCLLSNGAEAKLALAPFKLGLYDAVTIEFFVKAPSEMGSGWSSFARCIPASGSRFPFLFQGNGAGKLRCKADNPTTANTLYRDVSGVFDGKWHHVAITLKDNAAHTTETIAAFVDYKQDGVTTTKDGIFTVDSGHYLNIGSETYPVMLDEFRISRGVLPTSAFMRQKGPGGTMIIVF